MNCFFLKNTRSRSPKADCSEAAKRLEPRIFTPLTHNSNYSIVLCQALPSFAYTKECLRKAYCYYKGVEFRERHKLNVISAASQAEHHKLNVERQKVFTPLTNNSNYSTVLCQALHSFAYTKECQRKVYCHYIREWISETLNVTTVQHKLSVT